MNLENELRNKHAQFHTRRWFLRDCTLGLAGATLSSLMARESAAGTSKESMRPLAVKQPHFPARAKRVVYMFQAGAPSHLELFDYKPALAKHDGERPPASLLEGYRAAFINPNNRLLGPKYAFSRHGKSGMELSELLPETSKLADDMCLIRSLHTDAVNHAPAQIMLNTGVPQFGRPSLGAWTLYGLGCESENLPGYVVLGSTPDVSGGASNYGCGFLPNSFAGVRFRKEGDLIPHLSNPRGFDAATQRASLDTLHELNQIALADSGDPAVASRIESYEQAFRLQTSAPELMDLSNESRATLDMYGIKDHREPSYARNCLLARRLLERGTRFVQLFHDGWDQHDELTEGLKNNCQITEKASAALVRDLKQRGLLDDTLVIWGGEFGRTPMAQGGDDGRDHHNRSFSMWLAGGGVKPGHVHGVTDELGFNVARDPVHVHDLNATLLHLLGLDHKSLTYRFQGRDFRLTDVDGRVVREILA